MAFVYPLNKLCKENDDYRKIIYNDFLRKMELTIMSLSPGSEIPEEVHDDEVQFTKVIEGVATVIINREMTYTLGVGDCIIIPNGIAHRILNLGVVDLKIFTIYSPSEDK